MPRWIASLPKVEATWTSCLQTLEGNSSDALAFSPNGELLASAGNGTIRLWDPIIGELRGTLEHLPEGNSDDFRAVLAFTPDGELLAAAGSYTIRFWDPLAGSLIEAIVFSPNGQLVASIQDYIIEIWDLTTGELRGWLSCFL